MTMAQAAYANNSATVFQARFDRYLNDVLAAPMRAWQVNLALNVGGAVRALLIGAGLLAVALALTGVPIHAPLALAAAIFLLLVLFCSFGVVVGVYAESWDHTAFVTNLVILPLSFLGGVFYSVASLPSPWEEISRANPIHYLIDAVRYGFLGTQRHPDLAVARRHRRDRRAVGRLERLAVRDRAAAQAVGDARRRSRTVDQRRRRSSPRSRATTAGPRSTARGTTTSDRRTPGTRAAMTPCGRNAIQPTVSMAAATAAVRVERARPLDEALAGDVERDAQAVAVVGDRVAQQLAELVAVALAPRLGIPAQQRRHALVGPTCSRGRACGAAPGRARPGRTRSTRRSPRSARSAS